MKKIFKNSFMALAVLALGFSACTEQVEYTPAQVPSNNQVFFPNTNGSQIDINKDAQSFDVVVSRVVAGEAAIVPVTVVADELGEATFDFPAAVEFVDTMTTAIYTVTVKEGAGLDYTQYASVAITLDSLFATPYGDATYRFKVGVPAPWSEWEKVKTATYNYTGSYWSGAFEGVTVRYRESLINDVEGQFGVTYIEKNEKGEDVEYGMAGGFEFLIDYNRKTGECQVLPQQVDDNATYGPVFVCDLPHYPHQAGLSYENYPCTYDAEKGLFTLTLIYCVNTEWGSAANGQFGNGVETIQLDGFKAYDYNFSMQFKGHYVDNNGTDNAVISVSKGVDVTKYLMTVISADEDANATIQGMLAGTVACDTLTQSGYYAYPITASGNYVALAITYDANEEALEAHTTEFEFWAVGDENPWESLGYAMYTEDCLTTFYEVANETYPVEVRQHKDYPGLFRVIHPYEAYGADTSKEYFIEIDATDPEAVIIPGVYGTGLDTGYGEISLTSMAYFYMATQGATKEDVKDAGYTGVLAENVITFPVEGLLISMPDYEDGGFYPSNVNGMFKLDMSNMTAEYPEMPEDSEASEAPAARVSAERGVKNLEGGIKFGNRFKKIDNSFLTPTEFPLAD